MDKAPCSGSPVGAMSDVCVIKACWLASPPVVSATWGEHLGVCEQTAGMSDDDEQEWQDMGAEKRTYYWNKLPRVLESTLRQLWRLAKDGTSESEPRCIF